MASCPFDRRLGIDGPARPRRPSARDGCRRSSFLESLQHEPPADLLERLEARLPVELRTRPLTWSSVTATCACRTSSPIRDHDRQRLIDLGRPRRADRYADIALLLANARETWPDGPTARRFDRDFAEGYRVDLDHDRRDFYLLLDPGPGPGGADEAEPSGSRPSTASAVGSMKKLSRNRPVGS